VYSFEWVQPKVGTILESLLGLQPSAMSSASLDQFHPDGPVTIPPAVAHGIAAASMPPYPTFLFLHPRMPPNISRNRSNIDRCSDQDNADKHYWKHNAYIFMTSGNFPAGVFIYGRPESTAVGKGIYFVAACALTCTTMITGIDWTVQRRQWPLRLAYATTFNSCPRTYTFIIKECNLGHSFIAGRDN